MRYTLCGELICGVTGFPFIELARIWVSFDNTWVFNLGFVATFECATAYRVAIEEFIKDGA